MADHAVRAAAGDDPEDAAAIQRELGAAWRYFGRRGPSKRRRPKNVVDAVLGLNDYQRCKAQRLSSIGEFKRTHPEFTDLYRRVRMCCGACDGYLVVRKHFGYNCRFAGCSRYTDTGCRFTESSREYADRKSEVVIAIMCGTEPQSAYFLLDHVASRRKGLNPDAPPGGQNSLA